MIINMRDGEIVVEVPAKINLFLEVLGKRKDGYHDIDTIIQAISLRDRLTFRPTLEGVRILASGEPMPLGWKNTIYQVALRLRQLHGVRTGAEIEVEKRIPIGAGLGGGSADAAAALVGLTQLWELSLSTHDLVDLATGVGSDVAFFLYGGTARCEGRGERVTPIRGALDEQRFRYVIYYPGFCVSTAMVYGELNSPLTENRTVDSMTAESILEGITTGSLFYNRLQEIAFNLYPELGAIKECFDTAPFSTSFMSGSGSSLVGLCKDKEESRSIVQMLTPQLRDYRRGRFYEVTSEPSKGMLS